MVGRSNVKIWYRSHNHYITLTNRSISGDCLALHGYTNTSNNIHYAFRKINQNFAEIGTETDFGRYTYEYYVQRIGNHTTLNGFNFIPQSTEGADTLTPTTYNNRRIFYRVISCGYGPNENKIVPFNFFFLQVVMVPQGMLQDQ